MIIVYYGEKLDIWDNSLYLFIHLHIIIIISMWIFLNLKDPKGNGSAEGAHGRPPDLLLLLQIQASVVSKFFMVEVIFFGSVL